MLRAARCVITKISSLADSYRPYVMSGPTKQLVWPYMVSGRSVAATRNTFLPSTPANALTCAAAASGHETTSILTPVYSCGPTASPLERSWSMHGWPSLIE